MQSSFGGMLQRESGLSGRNVLTSDPLFSEHGDIFSLHLARIDVQAHPLRECLPRWEVQKAGLCRDAYSHIIKTRTELKSV